MSIDICLQICVTSHIRHLYSQLCCDLPGWFRCVVTKLYDSEEKETGLGNFC